MILGGEGTLCFSRFHHSLMSHASQFHSLVYLSDPWKHLGLCPCHIELPWWLSVKNSPAMQETQGTQECPGEGNGNHSTILSWESNGQRSVAGDGPWGHKKLSSVQFTSVTQSCPTLCDPLIRSTSGLPVHHQLLESTKTHVHWIGDAIQPSHPLFIPFSSHLQSYPATRSFPKSQLFAWGGQSIGLSTSTSVLQVNTQGLFPLGWTGSISLQSKGLSRVFSNTTVQKHQFFSAQISL